MQKVAAARLSILSNSFLVVAKLAVGLAIGSLSVLAEAIHSGLDLLAALIAYFSVREAGKPADDRHPFGHGKIENLSGTIEALLVLAAAVWIAVEAIRHLLDGTTVRSPGAGIAVMAVSAILNGFLSRYLLRVAEATDSVALRADALHLLTDVYTSAGVLGGLALLKLTGYAILDPLVALAVAALILRAAWLLLRQSFLPLLDISLPGEEQEEILRVIEGFRNRYLEVHMLRTRKAGGERHIDLHLVLPKAMPIAEAHRLCDDIEAALAARYPASHVLIHVEPCDELENGRCTLDAVCEYCRACPALPAGGSDGQPMRRTHDAASSERLTDSGPLFGEGQK